eukprot:4232-Hanusia_phi.AAC.1
MPRFRSSLTTFPASPRRRPKLDCSGTQSRTPSERAGVSVQFEQQWRWGPDCPTVMQCVRARPPPRRIRAPRRAPALFKALLVPPGRSSL